MYSLKKRVASAVLSAAVFFTMLPMPMTAYGASDTIYTPLKLVEQGEAFYNNRNTSGAGWTPMSLTQFTLKAAGIDTEVTYNTNDSSQYIYANKVNGKRFNKDNPYHNLLGEADRIFDLIADETDPETLKTCVENLLGKQGEDGLFTAGGNPNALTQARVILALDAYYGADYEQPWGNIPNDSKKGRIAAVKALIGLLNAKNPGATVANTIVPSATTGLSPYGFNNANMATYSVGFPILTLSGYTDCPITVATDSAITVGEMAQTTISKGLATVEGAYKSNTLSDFSNFIYLVPAILSVDGMTVDTNELPTLGGKPTTPNVNNPDADKVNAKNLIDTYQLLKCLDKLTVYTTEGSIWTGAAKFEANAREFLTQQCVLAASDMINGETAWKRIITPHAKNVNDVAADLKRIEIPSYTYDNLNMTSTGENGSQIDWKSSDTATVATNGAVTAPEKGSKNVTLTATVTKGDASKAKTFVVMVKSNAKDKAAEALDRAMAKFDEKYQKDISNIGTDGVFALSCAGRKLDNYTVAPIASTGGISVINCAKTVLQLVYTDKNPYDQKGTDYVDALYDQNIGGGVECAWALLAFDAVNKDYSADLIDKVKELAENETSTLQDRSMAACALANHKNHDGVPAALLAVKSAIIAKQDKGMFGADINDHAAAVSALVSMGEDLSLDQWMQDTKTPLTVLESEEKINLNVIIALGDMVSEKNVYQKSILTRSSYEQIKKQVKDLLDSGEGIYSENSLIRLKTAYDNAGVVGDNGIYGKNYYELKTAIAELSTAQMKFNDADKYNAEGIEAFRNAADQLKDKLSQKTASAKELSDAAKFVNDAYKDLQKKNTLDESKVYASGQMSHLYLASAENTEKSIDTQKQIAGKMLNKTIAGYDAKYGYDISGAGGYWGVFEVCAMGKDISKYKVFDVTTHKSGALTTYQATDFAAIILQLVLTGENPYDYKGTNYVEWLLKEDDGKGNFGPWANNIWALMALDAAGAEYNDNLVKTVIGQAKSESFDPDMRGWALAAIQNHKDKVSNAEIDAIVKSLQGKLKNASASIAVSPASGNAFTQGCLITGINAAGVDMTTEEWTAEGLNPLTALEKMQTKDGTFLVGDFNADFVKDAVIALGDVVQGSNVWQRTCLTQEKIDQAVSESEALLSDTTTIYPSAKIAALKSAVKNVKEIAEVKGNGKQYYKLLEAKKNLVSVAIPDIKNADIYDFTTFSPFKTAITQALKELSKEETSVASLNSLCEQIVLSYHSLKADATPIQVKIDTYPNKTQYQQGESFEPSGMSVTAVYKSGEEATIDPAVLEIIGFDSKQWGVKYVRVAYKGVSSVNNFKIIISENKESETGKTAQISVSDPKGKTFFSKGKISIGDQETALSLLQKTGLYVDVDMNTQYGAYVRGIEGLSEFDKGPNSGWMYKVNGKFPQHSAAYEHVKEGDYVEWLYTRDLGKDIGGDDVSGKSGTASSANNTATVSISVAAKIDTSGRAVASVTAKDMSSTLAKALDAAKAAEKEGKKNIVPMVRLDVSADNKATAVETAIPAASVKEAVKENAALTMATPVGTITFDQKALAGISESAGSSDVKISVAKVDKTKTDLPKALAANIGTLFELKVTSGDKAITNFKEGKVTVSLPYTPSSNEKVSDICVYYVDNDENLVLMKGSSYDEKTGLVTFETNHFSCYAIGTVISDKFQDVKNGQWFYENIMYLINKGILNGKSESQFAPNDQITRAEFVQILYRLVQAEAKVTGSAIASGGAITTGTAIAEGASQKTFSDVKSSAWYAKAVAWAYESNVITGLHGSDGTLNFAPNANITRQDMAVMIKNFIEKVEKKEMPQTVQNMAFTDSNDIAGYAREAVSMTQQSGIISGTSKTNASGNAITVFFPKNQATRAEAATMIAKLLKIK